MANSNAPPIRFRSYLLRLWQEDAPSAPTWRIVLINLQSGRRRGFANYDQLARFLSEVQDDEADLSRQSLS